jgi:hypothetical protein
MKGLLAHNQDEWCDTRVADRAAVVSLKVIEVIGEMFYRDFQRSTTYDSY